LPLRRPEDRCDELRLAAGLVACGGRSEAGSIAVESCVFEEIFGSILTGLASLAPAREDAGWLVDRGRTLEAFLELDG
jgi:hypothetical protein